MSPSKQARRWHRFVASAATMLALMFGGALSGFGAAMAATCTCNVTCTSSSGPTLSKHWNERDMIQLPPGPQAGKCKDYCQATLNKQTAIWALEGKLCKTGSCSGTAKLGTLSAYNLTAVSFDNSSQNFCGVSGPSNLCCPEFSKALTREQLSSMFSIGSHVPGSPYTYNFSSNINTTNLAAYMGQWANWLRFDGCPQVAGFRLQINVYETNVDGSTSAAPLPTAPNGPLLAAQSISMTPSVVPSTFTLNMASSPNWRRTRVSMVPVDAYGKPAQCSKVGGCDIAWTYAWRPTTIAAKIANPARPTPAHRLPGDAMLKEPAVQELGSAQLDTAP